MNFTHDDLEASSWGFFIWVDSVDDTDICVVPKWWIRDWRKPETLNLIPTRNVDYFSQRWVMKNNWAKAFEDLDYEWHDTPDRYVLPTYDGDPPYDYTPTSV